MLPLAVIALGATLGTATALIALCGIFFVCNSMRMRKGLSDSGQEEASESTRASVLQSSQQFSIEKTTEPIQPKALLQFPNIYSPKLALTLPEIINCADIRKNPATETPVPADEDINNGKDGKTQGTSETCDLPSYNLHKDPHRTEHLDPEQRNSRSPVPKLHFSLVYDREKAEVTVACLEAVNGILEGNEEALCDCYVLGSLVTSTGKIEAQTALVNKKGHVVWEDTLLLPLVELEKQEAMLTLTLRNCDRFSRHNIAGEIRLSLANVEAAAGPGLWVDLKSPGKDGAETNRDTTSGGEVLLSISYLPAASRLMVVLIKARDLPSSGLDDLLSKDMSVKVTLRHLALKVKKKQTKRVKQKISPVWNEMIMFEVPQELLGSSSVELEMLCQHTPGGPYHVLGRCHLGLQSVGTERNHWQEMLNNPRRQIAMWHQLHQ